MFIFSNHVLNTAVLGWFMAQFLKGVLASVRERKFLLERFFGSGGMPSSHSSLVTALLTTVLITCGYASAEFAIAAVFWFITTYDAGGVRYAVGEQAKIINKMVDEWLDKTYWSDKNLPQVKQLKEMLGHTPLEVLGGMVVAIVISLLV